MYSILDLQYLITLRVKGPVRQGVLVGRAPRSRPHGRPGSYPMCHPPPISEACVTVGEHSCAVAERDERALELAFWAARRVQRLAGGYDARLQRVSHFHSPFPLAFLHIQYMFTGAPLVRSRTGPLDARAQCVRCTRRTANVQNKLAAAMWMPPGKWKVWSSNDRKHFVCTTDTTLEQVHFNRVRGR